MLTFRRGTHENLNNIDITQDMLYFTTDDNSIYFDSNNERYKIFGINNNDIISSTNNASINKYFNQSFDGFLTNDDFAMDGDTTHSKAIGRGYYNDIIGNNYYNRFKTNIINAINFIQSQGRSELSLLWSNNSPSSTWHNDLSTSQITSIENTSFNITTSYLGYIFLVQSYLDNNSTVYPVIMFVVPNSISNNEAICKTITQNYNIGQNPSTIIQASLKFQFSGTNYKTITITKEGHLRSGSSTIDFHKYLVPIELYGWSV